jgi:hypothetical protein
VRFVNFKGDRCVFSLLVLFAFASSGMSAQSQGPESLPRTPAAHRYFPQGVFAAASGADDIKAAWYTHTLTALTEPSLLEVSGDKAAHVYRFFWLPSFHRPISVRLTINSDGSGLVVARSVDEHTGLLTKKGVHDSGKLILDTVGNVDQSQVREFLGQLQKLKFWTMTAEDDGSSLMDLPVFRTRMPPVDGAQWVLEGVKNGAYHIVDRWSPESGGSFAASSQEYARLCRYLLQLGNVDVKNLY